MTSANRTRLGIFVPHTGMSGAEVAIDNLLRGLPHEQFDVYLFAPQEQPLRQIAQAQGYNVCDYPSPHFFSTSLELGQRRFLNPFAILYNLLVVVRDALKLSRFVNEQQIQVLYTGSMMGHLMAYLVRRSNHRIRVLIHLQELVSSRPGRFVFQIIAKGADEVVVISQAVSRVLHGSRPVKLIYYGIDLNLYQANHSSTLRDELNIPAERLIIGVVGRLTPWKGHKVFLEAAQILINQGFNGHFVIVGDSINPVTGQTPYRAELEAYRDKLSLQKDVIFLGHRKDTSNIMSGVDILVVPSVRPEPFGLVTGEAMASGKPVVASNIGGLPEIVCDRVTGRLFAAGDAKALADALYSLASDPALRSQYGQAGRERIENHFTLDRYNAEMAEVFMRTAQLR